MQDWDDLHRVSTVGPLGKLVEEAEVHYAYVSVRFLGEVMLFWGKLERLDF